MKMLPFKESAEATIGVELEFQIIHPKSYKLLSRSRDLLRNIQESKYQSQIKPEITQSMIEINSSIHRSINDVYTELVDIKNFLLAQANDIHAEFCGGGTHPFHKWSKQKIFPSARYKTIARKYRYLSKQATVFGQHIHFGCKNGEDAIYLTHALSRYVPHFIAISASSPFYQGVDTGYFSSRSTIFGAFPLSGVMPFLKSWDEFVVYFYKMCDLDIAHSMKDFYWDVRPKPEFGTVEIRVCDTPLTVRKAAIIAAYVQALSLYLLEEKPISICPELYYLYNYNRFQASRYGIDGVMIDPVTSQSYLIKNDIINTIKKIERYANQLKSMGFLSHLMDDIIHERSDATFLRKKYKQTGSLQHVVEAECQIWKTDAENGGLV